MVTERWLFEFGAHCSLDSCLWGWMEGEVYKRKVDTRDELLARILDASVRMKQRKDQLRRTARDLRTRVAKCVEVTVGFSNVFCELK
jgi:hypothetical protein